MKGKFNTGTTTAATVVLAAAILAGCANPQQQNTAVGAGVGAAAGAGLGALLGNTRGAVIGGALGAAAGGAVGYNWQAIHQKLSGATAGTGTQVTEQPDGSLKVNIPSSISFDTDSYAIKPGFRPVLAQVGQTLAEHPDLNAQVVGHTDSTGSPAYNLTLSRNRAQSVASFLAQNGAASSRLSANGVGQTQPIADNGTAAGRSQNRRVEIYLRPIAQAQ